MSDQIPVVDCRLDLTIRLPFVVVEEAVLSSLRLNPRHTRNSSVDHESQEVLDIIKRKNSSILFAPQPLVVHVGASILERAAYSRNRFRVCDGDFQIPAFLVPLESINVLPQCYFDRLDGALVASESTFEKGSVRVAVLLREPARRGDVEVVLESRNMQQD